MRLPAAARGPTPSAPWSTGRSTRWRSRSSGPRRGSTSTRSRGRGRRRNGCSAILAQVPAPTGPGSTSRWPRPSTRSRERLRVPVETLRPPASKQLATAAREPRGPARPGPRRRSGRESDPAAPVPSRADPARRTSTRPIGNWSQIVLNEPSVVGRLISRVAVASIRDAPLRAILQACYDLHGEGNRRRSSGSRCGSTTPRCGPWRPACCCRSNPPRCPSSVRPAPWEDRLAGVLAKLAERDRQDRLRDLKAALEETDRDREPGRVPGPESRISTTHEPAAGHEDEKRVLTRRSVREGGFWMEKLDEGLKTLLDLGKRRGFLTFDQVNDYLPDEASSPEKIHGLLESLDEMGIELINEDEAESRLLASGDLDDEPDELVDEPVDEDDGELTPEDLDEISRRIDDPVRMYLTQMGEIPLLTREQEIALAKKIEVTRKRFRRKVLECDYALRHGRRDAQDGPRRRAAVRPHRQGLGDREPGEGPDPRPDAAQPADARTPDGAEQSTTSARYVRERDRTTAPRAAGRRSSSRRRKAVTLVEELSIRDAEGPAADEAARADRARGWTSWKASSRTTAPAAAARRTAPTSQKELQGPDADHARRRPSSLRQARRGR